MNKVTKTHNIEMYQAVHNHALVGPVASRVYTSWESWKRYTVVSSALGKQFATRHASSRSSMRSTSPSSASSTASLTNLVK